MKNYRVLFILLLLFTAMATAPACKTKSGCEATESLKPKAGKDGSYKASKKRDDGLFPKKMSKKMK